MYTLKVKFYYGATEYRLYDWINRPLHFSKLKGASVPLPPFQNTPDGLRNN